MKIDKMLSLTRTSNDVFIFFYLGWYMPCLPEILHKNGIPDENIVVMMYDDIANNPL